MQASKRAKTSLNNLKNIRGSPSAVFKNTKIKHYRDGCFTLCRCSHRIFKSSNWECHDTVNTSTIENNAIWELLQKEFTENIITLRSDDGLPLRFWDVSKDNRFHVKRLKYGDIRSDSLKRAKDSIFDIVYENDWSWFVTFTFNNDDVDRFSSVDVMKKLRVWLDNAVRRKKLSYVLVPELHKKGGIHCHALFNDCDLKFLDSGTRCVKGFDKPVKLSTIREKNMLSRSGLSEDDLKVVYNIKDWKYGFSTAIKTYGDPANLAFYLTKYLTKDVKKIFGRFYWHSHNIRTKPEIEYLDTDFELNSPVVSVSGVNRSYQYLSSFTFGNNGNFTEHEKTQKQIEECREAERKFNELCKELGL